MKTAANRFSNVIKEVASTILKENGFKKQGLNFYRPIDEISHTINIQKDKWNTKEEIRFTLNIGVFSNKYWLSEFDYDEACKLPKFPNESTSIVRERIGELKLGKDHWYTIESQKLEYALIKELKEDIKKYVLPFLNSITNVNELIQYLKNNQTDHGNDYKLFIMLAEEGFLEEAEVVYSKMKKSTSNIDRLKSLTKKGAGYKIEKS